MKRVTPTRRNPAATYSATARSLRSHNPEEYVRRRRELGGIECSVQKTASDSAAMRRGLDVESSQSPVLGGGVCLWNRDWTELRVADKHIAHLGDEHGVLLQSREEVRLRPRVVHMGRDVRGSKISSEAVPPDSPCERGEVSSVLNSCSSNHDRHLPKHAPRCRRPHR